MRDGPWTIQYQTERCRLGSSVCRLMRSEVLPHGLQFAGSSTALRHALTLRGGAAQSAEPGPRQTWCPIRLSDLFSA